MLRALVGLVLVLGACVPDASAQLLLPGQLPRKSVIETSYVLGIRWAPAEWKRATALLRRRMPNEAGMCLYGGFERIAGGYTLVVNGALEAQVGMATPDSVRFQCPRDPSWLGTLHTHRLNGGMCTESAQFSGTTLGGTGCR